MNFNNTNNCLSSEVRQMIADNRLDDAVAEISALISKFGDNADLLFERGKLLWKLGRKAGAISDYAAAAQIDSDSPAVTALEMARNVMDFYNKDMYNP